MSVSVLIADDQDFMRDVIRMIINRQQTFHIVDEARDGQDAITKVDRWQPDIIFIDLIMPGCSGIEATRHIAALYPHIRIVGLCPPPFFLSARLFRDAGATVVVPKTELFSGITRALLTPSDGFSLEHLPTISVN